MTVPAPFLFNARVVSVHDGDTINVVVDRGMYDYAGTDEHPVPVRLAGCNARELTADGGIEARDHLAGLLPPGTAVVLATVKPDKYAPRWDARVATAAVEDVTALLVADGWAAAWDGTGKAPVPPWPRTAA